ncbi:hypothetical protein HAX54_036237 [Datura stramonium]|uniref:Glycosyltransferase N-terminal domain-containing protein n=1 Tax=Datura stramonium TaxID=4076 RepID=A0ABS8VHT4_DATST|nr:hypothetical protein [Datura stramonium]
MCSYEHEILDNLKQDHEVVIVMVPFQIQGHLNQLLQLACLMSSSYDLPVYYIGPSTLNSQARIRANALNPSDIAKIHFHDIPAPEFASPPPDFRLDKFCLLNSIISRIGTMEIKELAMGLEQSKQRFLWVLRDADRGGFMSHCGWNSCIESITMGVPIAAWPMHADQPRNGFLVTEMLKIGLTVREWEKREELVSASTIENVVRKLMASEEGNAIRKRAEELGESVRRSTEKGGASRMELDSFIAHITR